MTVRHILAVTREKRKNLYSKLQRLADLLYEAAGDGLVDATVVSDILGVEKK